MSKRRYKKKALPVRIGDTSTIERRKQGRIVTEILDRDASGQAIIKRQRAIAECVLDAYYLRQFIDDAEYEAGMRLRKAYIKAVLRVRVEDRGSGNHGDLEIGLVMAAESELLLRQAYSVLSVEEKAVIVAVCGHDNWAGSEYRFRILHRGLQTLAKHWGFA